MDSKDICFVSGLVKGVSHGSPRSCTFYSVKKIGNSMRSCDAICLRELCELVSRIGSCDVNRAPAMTGSNLEDISKNINKTKKTVKEI